MGSLLRFPGFRERVFHAARKHGDFDLRQGALLRALDAAAEKKEGKLIPFKTREQRRVERLYQAKLQSDRAFRKHQLRFALALLCNHSNKQFLSVVNTTILGHSTTDVAREFGVSPAAISAHKRRGLAFLAARVNGLPVTITNHDEGDKPV